MKREPVASSSIASVGYDPSGMVLEVEYRNGKLYRYVDVPRAIHRLLMQAHSMGDFVNREVKPRFSVVAVPASPPPSDRAEGDDGASMWESGSQSPLVAFYAGLGRDASGRTFEQILAFSDAELERVHDYIQWLFPLAEPSAFNPRAPLVSEMDRLAFASHARLRQRLSRALERMCGFYGFAFTGSAKADDAPKIEWRSPRPAPPWLAPGDHNYLRLTRMLTSLRLLGASAHAGALWACLKDVYAAHADVIGSRTFDFWRRAAE